MARPSRRQQRMDRLALLAVFWLAVLAGAVAYVRSWYHQHQAAVDGVLRWAVPLGIALAVAAAALMIRSAVRREHRSKIFIKEHGDRVRAKMAEVAAREAAEVEQEPLPGPEYLYRFHGWWQDPDHPAYPNGPWHEGVQLYIGRSNDFEARNNQHEADSHWHPNVVGSTQQVFRSYIDASGHVVTAHEQLVEAERVAIETEGSKHNILHNGAQGRRERLLREQIRAYEQQHGRWRVEPPRERRRPRQSA